MPPFRHSSMTNGQSLLGLEDGGTEGFELGWGGVGNIDGIREGWLDLVGSPDGSTDVDGSEEGCLSVGDTLFDGT